LPLALASPLHLVCPCVPLCAPCVPPLLCSFSYLTVNESPLTLSFGCCAHSD
jgi:hypothetical protein